MEVSAKALDGKLAQIKNKKNIEHQILNITPRKTLPSRYEDNRPS